MKNPMLLIAISLLITTCQKESIQTYENAFNTKQGHLTDIKQNDIIRNFELAQNIMNAPVQSGSKVFRIVDGIYEIGLILADEKSGLTAIVGVDNELFCTSFELEYDILPIQDVIGTSREDRIIRLQKGEVQTTIYEGVWPWGTFICDFTNNSSIIAQGTSDLVINDNDLLVWQTEENKNHNSFSYKAHGTLTHTNGSRVSFNGHANGVWDGNNLETFRYYSVSVVLR